MKLFGFDFNSDPNRFKITDNDRFWVEENFSWLIQVFGYPNKAHPQFLLNEKFFPRMYATDGFSLENIINDLCMLLSLEQHKISTELLLDIRDSANIPYATQGTPFICDVERKEGLYTIHLSNSLLRHHNRLIHQLILVTTKIRLLESGLEYDVGGDDTNLFLYLAGIYYGFGVILSQQLTDMGRKSDGYWEIQWNYAAEMPIPVMAFSLAMYAILRGEDDPEWKKELPGDFRKTFESALQHSKQYPSDLFSEPEIRANELFNKADEEFEQNNHDAAISTLQKILFITNDEHMKADVYNNMGYYYLRKREYEKSISCFHKALALGPEYGYANDNLGYVLIVTGDLEQGKWYVEKAMETKNNDMAYSYRNMALYYAKKNDNALAEHFFQKAFQQKTPVDLLEFHYAQFLFSKGDRNNALKYLQQAVDKNEQEAIAWMKELNRP